jgi:phosphate ABC transporter permease protein PstC
MVAMAVPAGNTTTLFSPALVAWRGRRWSDLALWAVSLGFILLGTGALLLIVLYVAAEALPALKQAGGLKGLLFDLPWAPLAEPPSYGILHAWLSSLMVTALSLLLAVPVALGVAIFTSEIAPPFMRGLLQPCMELLAGIPSVVYGFFGYVTLIPLLENSFGLATGECILAAGLILAVMVLPFIASTATEALRGVPGNLRESAYATGVTRWHVIQHVVLRQAAPGLFAAVVLGLARAIGEALAVLMLTGNATAVPNSLMDRGQPITALILTELGEAGVDSDKYHVLMASGLLLMVITVVINLAVLALKRRMLPRHV